MRKLTAKSILFLILFMTVSITSMAQFGNRTPRSPEINPDNTVTFRLLAKLATKVGLTDMSRFGIKDDPEARVKNLENLRKSGVKLYWIACGKDDFLFNAATDLRKFLDDNKFPYQYLETTGGHTWTNWRIYLTELAQKLFK